MSDFIKKAIEMGRVKDLSEAFEEYPSEEEWHKGKIENIIKEKDFSYGDVCQIGDIVFVRKYYYDNLEIGNNHLFVIIDKDNMAVPIENFGMLISSKMDKLKYNSNILLKKDDKNKLEKDSIVKTDVIYKILNKYIVFKLGAVEIEKVNEYKKCFFKLSK